MRYLPSAIFLTGLLTTFTVITPVQSAHADTIERSFSASQKSAVNKSHLKKAISRHPTRARYSHARPAIISAVRRHAKTAGVPVRVGLAVVRQESNFRPRALGSAGEIGLMQLKCTTARGMGYRGTCAGLYKVSTNLTYGMRYLRKALKRGSVAYYNAGIGAKRLPARAHRYARQVKRRI